MRRRRRKKIVWKNKGGGGGKTEGRKNQELGQQKRIQSSTLNKIGTESSVSLASVKG